MRIDIVEYANVINKQLQVLSRHDAKKGMEWYCQFENSKITRGSAVVEIIGNGSTPGKAITDYCRKVSGKRLVFNNMDKKNRQEYGAPTELSFKGKL